MNKLALGTVQFGLNYGVANTQGQVSQAEIQAILALAKKHQVHTLDTAIAYGDSETRLGQQDLTRFEVISKVAEIPAGINVQRWLEQQCERSLTRLNIPQLEGFLLHRPEQLLGNKGSEIYAALQALKTQGLVKKVGISIYGPKDLEALQDFQFDLYQGPFNVLDQRLKTSGWLHKLQQQGAEFHARSAFLQGLLLMPIEQRPAKFNPWQPLWQRWQNWLTAQQLNATTACLKFSLQEPLISKTVVGVDSSQQWQELLNIAASADIVLPTELSCEDELLLNPALWSTL